MDNPELAICIPLGELGPIKRPILPPGSDPRKVSALLVSPLNKHKLASRCYDGQPLNLRVVTSGAAFIRRHDLQRPNLKTVE